MSPGARIPLAATALLAGAAPLLGAAALGASGSAALAAILPLEGAFEASLALSATVVTVAWPLLALGKAREGGSRSRSVELLVLLAGLAPGLRAAALVSRVPEDLAARAWVGLYVLAAAYGLALAGLAATRLRRSTIATLGAALALGAPLACAYARAAEDGEEPLLRASAPAAVLELLDRGSGFPWALLLVLASVGVLLSFMEKARARRAAGAAA
ncbi:hypothetical protein HY251_10275, partial [bacterium]|nr:hypothetical protein [bacterium]